MRIFAAGNNHADTKIYDTFMEKKQTKQYTPPDMLVVRVKMQASLLQGSVLGTKGDYGPWITDEWSDSIIEL